MRKVLFLALAAGLTLFAHPMGNFSINHYARLEFGAEGARLTYVLDLAEIPAFELMQQLGPDWKSKLGRQAAQWLANVALTQHGRPVDLRVIYVAPAIGEGAAGMPVLRVAIAAAAPLEKGEVAYEDRNFEGRAGWKEIVVTHDSSARILHSSQSAQDLSKALTYYPADPAITPPHDLTARITWAPIEVSAPSVTEAPVAPRPAPSFTAQQPQAAGTVVAGDYLSHLLGRKQLGWSLMLLGLAAAFGLGAMHAMSPGHGKTIVAAYLVGSRGTLKHAALLGFVVTFTHTFTVFLLGLGVLFFQQYVVPEKIVPLLGAISGLSIVAVGAMLLYRRTKSLLAQRRRHRHHHHHVPEKVSFGSLIALGVSGGLVPCPSALILMLSAVALGRPALGLLLLTGFSAGLAAVLMGIGIVAVYARHLLPASDGAMRRPLFRLIPVFSSVVVICLGLAMTAVSAGWLQPMRFFS